MTQRERRKRRTKKIKRTKRRKKIKKKRDQDLNLKSQTKVTRRTKMANPKSRLSKKEVIKNK